MSLQRSAVLSVASDTTVRLRSDGTAEVSLRGRRLLCRSNVFGLLEVFRAPADVSMALDRLGARAPSAAEWIDITVTMQRLVEMGVLHDASGADEVVVERAHTFERPSQHICMLDDRPRTDAFLRAIRETVGADDVVVDIGTGTGVLAIGAARAGARHVYAIEAGAIANVARRLVAANGLSDRITVISGWSTHIELPQRANILVSEIIGSDAFDEEVLFVMRDAVRRLLTPDARLVPSHLELRAVPVDVPEAVWESEVYTSTAVERWRQSYGTDFSPLTTSGVPVRFFAARPDARSWTRLAEPVTLGVVDFKNAPLTLQWSAEGVAVAPSTRVGVMTFFEIALGSARRFSQDPLANEVAPDWPCPIWVTPGATVLEPGQRWRVDYSRSGASALSMRVFG